MFILKLIEVIEARTLIWRQTNNSPISFSCSKKFDGAKKQIFIQDLRIIIIFSWLYNIQKLLILLKLVALSLI